MSNKLDLQFIGDASDAGMRLDLFLVKKMPNLSRSKIQNAIKAGFVAVNDKKAVAHLALKENDRIKFSLPEESAPADKHSPQSDDLAS